MFWIFQYKAALVKNFIRQAMPHFESGRLKPIIDRVLPLDKISEAHSIMEKNENTGKLILRVQEETVHAELWSSSLLNVFFEESTHIQEFWFLTSFVNVVINFILNTFAIYAYSGIYLYWRIMLSFYTEPVWEKPWQLCFTINFHLNCVFLNCWDSMCLNCAFIVAFNWLLPVLLSNEYSLLPYQTLFLVIIQIIILYFKLR